MFNGSVIGGTPQLMAANRARRRLIVTCRGHALDPDYGAVGKPPFSTSNALVILPRWRPTWILDVDVYADLIRGELELYVVAGGALNFSVWEVTEL